MGLGTRIKNAWNAFNNRNEETKFRYVYEPSSSVRPDRTVMSSSNERSLVNAFYNRIAIDVAQIDVRHVKVNEEGQYKEYVHSTLDECLTTSANIDQTGRNLVQDIVMSMFDEGNVAVVPVECDVDPDNTDSYRVLSLRVGKVVEWFPQKVKVNLYNELTGKKEDVTLSKDYVAIIENPLYAVMNENNSTIKRLVNKLNMLDIFDERTASNKFNMIIQLPYTIKSEARKEHAEERRRDIESQLANSRYGIAYSDGTEKIIQLNRPLESGLLPEIDKYLEMLYSQLGLTKNVLDGTANEQEMLNYTNRTLIPILCSITEEFRRKFLSKTARTQGQSIIFQQNPFKLVPVNNLADIADKFTRNEILTSNEIRQIIGLEPNDDPRADELRNSNMPVQDLGMEPQEEEEYPEEEPYEEYPEEYDEEY